jgi:hypothetical protein
MLRVQTFAAITNLLLVLSESIFRVIHCKHHSWSIGTIGIFFLPLDLRSPLQGEPYMDSLHPYMDSLHLYMDPLHPLVCNIFNKFAGCPCCPWRFHNLYNSPCCYTNPWHHLWPSPLNQIQRGVVTSTQHFRGSTIAHLKYLFNISNGYFVEYHLAFWFERYHLLNIDIYLTQGGCAYHHLQRYFSPCSGNYIRISTCFWKYIFNISNGYFTESHLASWFEIYHQFSLSMYLTQGGRAYHYLQRYFSPCSRNYRRSSTYVWKYIFSSSNGSSTKLYFITCRRSCE